MKTSIPSIKVYIPKRNRVEAIQLLRPIDFHNAERWCGGEVRESQPTSDGDQDISLVIPTVGSAVHLRHGDYLVKDLDSGKFSRVIASEFQSLWQQVTRDTPEVKR